MPYEVEINGLSKIQTKNILIEMVERRFKDGLLTGQFLFGWNEPVYDYAFISYDYSKTSESKLPTFNVLYEYTDVNSNGDLQKYKKTIIFSLSQFNEYVAYKRNLKIDKLI